MVKTRFVTHGWGFFVSLPFILFPYVWAVFFFGLANSNWGWLVVAAIVSYLAYVIFHVCIGAMSFRGGFIRVPSSLVFFSPMQYGFTVNAKDVVRAKFTYQVGRDSRGNENAIYRGSRIRCLTLALVNGQIERVILTGFSPRQIRQMDKSIRVLFPHIEVDFDPFFWRNAH